MKPKLYFGHPVNFYNTPDEERLIKIIAEHFPACQIENPNQPHHQEGYQRWKKETGKGMDYYFQEVLPQMDAGIFLSFQDGMLGTGVFGEAEFLDEENKPIYEINLEGKIDILELDDSRSLSIEETRKRIYQD